MLSGKIECLKATLTFVLKTEHKYGVPTSLLSCHYLCSLGVSPCSHKEKLFTKNTVLHSNISILNIKITQAHRSLLNLLSFQLVCRASAAPSLLFSEKDICCASCQVFSTTDRDQRRLCLIRREHAAVLGN